MTYAEYILDQQRKLAENFAILEHEDGAVPIRMIGEERKNGGEWQSMEGIPYKNFAWHPTRTDALARARMLARRTDAHSVFIQHLSPGAHTVRGERGSWETPENKWWSPDDEKE